MNKSSFGSHFTVTTWGESHGAGIGVVVDGCVRDVEELTGLPIGIRALATTPMPPMKRQPGLIDVPVHIQGVPVLPGGWLYADADGIVISRTPLHPN